MAFATAGYADVNDQEIDGLRRQLQLELNYSSANISILIPNANERHTFANDQEAVAKDIVPIISDALDRMKPSGRGIYWSKRNCTRYWAVCRKCNLCLRGNCSSSRW